MQTAHSEEWRPGFAKRAENFSEVCAQAESWRWAPGETIARVAAAVLKGTPILTIPQRMTLLLYVEHLNQDRLEQDIACVWPSTSLIAEYLGCSESQARANRRALEAAGYLVRDYTRANRPAGIEAYDLRPLMAQLEALEGVDDAIREAQAARRAAYAETVAFPTKYSTQAPGFRRLEQSHENLKSSVRGTEAASPLSYPETRPATRPGNGRDDRSPGQRPRNGQAGAIGSPGGASVSGGVSSDPSVYAEMVRQELRTAIEVCPRLAPLVREGVLANPASATPEDAARIAAAAAELMPQPERNNDQTVVWGWRRHGIRVVTMMAIALEDPEVRSPCAYFGKLSGQDRGAADLRLNLTRILKAKGVVPKSEPAPPAICPDEGAAQVARLKADLVAPPGTEDPKWLALAVELKRALREGKFGSWFGRVGFHGLTDGVLALSSPSETVVRHIRENLIPDILKAADAADLFVDRVVLHLRGKDDV